MRRWPMDFFVPLVRELRAGYVLYDTPRCGNPAASCAICAPALICAARHPGDNVTLSGKHAKLPPPRSALFDT